MRWYPVRGCAFPWLTREMRTGLRKLPWPTCPESWPGQRTTSVDGPSTVHRRRWGVCSPQRGSAQPIRSDGRVTFSRMQILRDLATERGYFLRREAIQLGVDDRRLHRGVRTNQLVRIRQGAYCHVDIWCGLSEEDSSPRAGARHARPSRWSRRHVACVRPRGLRLPALASAPGTRTRHTDRRSGIATGGRRGPPPRPASRRRGHRAQRAAGHITDALTPGRASPCSRLRPAWSPATGCCTRA